MRVRACAWLAALPAPAPAPLTAPGSRLTRQRYGLKLVLGSAPFALTWCRYSFFLVLYPMGVTGELFTNYAAITATEGAGLTGLAATLAAMYRVAVWAFILLYIPGFPPLYMYMLGQRKKVLGKPRPAGPDMSQGIQFPKSNAATGERSTTLAGQAAFGFSALAASAATAMSVFKVRRVHVHWSLCRRRAGQ